MKIAPNVLFLKGRDEDYKNLTTLDVIFGELGIPSSNIVQVEAENLYDLKGIDILILPHWYIGHVSDTIRGKSKGTIIRDFVYRGGICWIMSQRQRGHFSFWLPENLQKIGVKNRYIDLDAYPPGMKPYVCPWILDREHPVWNKPNYIDEASFVFWKVRWAGEMFKTSATHVLFPPAGWKILAGFADNEIKLEDKAALVMESGYGKGLYFWTQIFSPELIWKRKGEEKKAWNLLLQNIFTYFHDFKERKILKLKVESTPWAVTTGDKVKININTAKGKDIKEINLEILAPSGSHEKIKTSSLSPSYSPQEKGTYQITAKVTDKNNRIAYGHTFFKATQKFTPFRFLTHTHFQFDWAPEHPGTLFGICRRLGIDAVVLAGGLFYGDEELYLRMSDEDLKKLDNPAVRFFQGEEVHTMHNYTEKEGGAKQPDNRRHATTVGCNSYPYTTDYWHPDNLVKIHKKKGIAIVAHPGAQSWWMKPQKGHNFEGIEFDRTKPEYWDKMLKQDKSVVGISGVDNLGPNRLFYPVCPNIGWFDKPFSLNSLIDTILKGRITKIATHPVSSSEFDVKDCVSILKKEVAKGKNNILWFDINNQLSGGILYATGKVKLNIKAKSSFPIKALRIVKNGNRNYKKIKIDRKLLDYSKEERIDKTAYYRIEIDSPEKYKQGGCLSFTNPIFIKKVKGPKDSYFYFCNQAPYFFDKNKGKYQTNLTRVKKVTFSGNVWKIELIEPGEGTMFIGAKHIQKGIIRLDDKKIVATETNKKSEEVAVYLSSGNHKVEIIDA